MTLCHVARFLAMIAVEALTVAALLAVSRSGLLDLLDEMRGAPRKR